MDTNGFILILLAMLIVTVILMLFISNRNKRQMKELERIVHQLDDMTTAPDDSPEEEPEQETPQENAVAEIIELTEEKQDAAGDRVCDVEASAYNTGKSGKVYTKEELELLIKE